MIYYRIGLKSMSDLKLNKELIDIHLVNKAIHDYKGLAKIHIKENNNYIVLRFEECKYNTEITKAEFENYVIDLMNSKDK